MKIDLYDLGGKKTGTTEVSDDLLGVEVQDHLLYEAVKAYRANRRQGTHATKTRSTVTGTGKKPFKQKGSGGARQGTKRSPHHYGGSVSHGPQPRDYTLGMNKKARRKALAMALTDRLQNKALFVVQDLEMKSYSTKSARKILGSFDASKALFVDLRKDDFLYKSVRNLYGSQSICADEVNAENVLAHPCIIMSTNGLQSLESRFSAKTGEVAE